MAVKGTNEQGAAGGANGAGAGEGEGEGTPRYVTADELNSALTGREKRLLPQIQKMVEQAITPIAERLAKPVTPAEGEGKGAAGDEVTRQLSDMQKRVEAAERRASEAEKQRADQEHKRAREEEVGTLERALRQGGVTDEVMLEAASTMLYHRQARIGRDKDGRVIFKLPREGYDDEVPVEKGVAEWLKGDAGKRFIAPRQVQGSGAAGARGARAPGGTQKLDPNATAEQRQAAQVELAKRQLLAGFGLGPKVEDE